MLLSEREGEAPVDDEDDDDEDDDEGSPSGLGDETTLNEESGLMTTSARMPRPIKTVTRVNARTGELEIHEDKSDIIPRRKYGRRPRGSGKSSSDG